jgi:hypothetical protein
MLVKQHSLQPAIRANNDAYLFPEPIVNKEENTGEDNQCRKSTAVCSNSLVNIAHHFIHTDQVGHEIIGNQEGDEIEYNNFQGPFPDLETIPGHGFQLLLFVEITINPVFNFPEYHFHENCLRACPSTKNTSKDYGKKDDEYNKRDHPEGKNEKVLWAENLTEKDEFPF